MVEAAKMKGIPITIKYKKRKKIWRLSMPISKGLNGILQNIIKPGLIETGKRADVKNINLLKFFSILFFSNTIAVPLTPKPKRAMLMISEERFCQCVIANILMKIIS